MRVMMAANGLRDGDYVARTIPSSSLRVAAMQAGQISAAVMGDRDALMAQAIGAKSFGFVHQYVKDIAYSGYLADDNWARANQDTMVRFLRALLRSTEWLFDPANKEQAKRIYAEASDLDMDQTEVVYSTMVGQRMLSRNLRPDLRGVENMLKLAYELGAIPEVPALDRWIDLSYLDKASR
jgi:ABC-type nitrate/sulfonate/bicarbonate transport system substrate-binding protein